APENPSHPDHGLAQALARGFWASLPYLDRNLIAELLSRARPGARRSAGPDFSAAIDSEAFRAALGRIACGYDGGQIVEECQLGETDHVSGAIPETGFSRAGGR